MVISSSFFWKIFLRNYIKEEVYSRPSQISKMEFFTKSVNYYVSKIHFTCLTGFSMHLRKSKPTV